MKIDENCGPHFGVDSEKGSHTRREPVKTKLASKHVRTTAENQKKNSRSVAALTFFPRDMLFLFVQLTRSTQLSYFLSLDDYLRSVKLVTVVEGDPKDPFSIATTPKCRDGHNSFPGIDPLCLGIRTL